MAFCKFCGKELGEDGKCTCAEFGDYEKNAGILNNSIEKKIEKPIKRGSIFKYIIIAIIIILAVITTFSIISLINSYKKPIDTLAKGIRKADTELLIESMYTESTAAELRLQAKENGLTWKEYIKKNDKAIESAMDGLGVKRVKADVLAKEKLSGSNLENVKKFYQDNYNIDVKKAYRVEVEFSLKINGEKTTRTGWLCVAKLKGEGWTYCPQCSSDTFDFLDSAVRFE